MAQEAPDQVVMPLLAAELSQSPICRWVLSTDTIWYLPVLAPCRLISRIKQTLDSISESLLEEGCERGPLKMQWRLHLITVCPEPLLGTACGCLPL